MDGQGYVCLYELGGTGLGYMEGQRDGAPTVSGPHQANNNFQIANGSNRTTRSDWLAWETERVPLETAVFAF